MSIFANGRGTSDNKDKCRFPQSIDKQQINKEQFDMNILTGIRNLFGMDGSRNDRPSNDSVAATDRGNGSYLTLFRSMQALCNALPDGQVFVDMSQDEVCLHLKWNPAMQGLPQENATDNHLLFSVDGTSDEVTIYNKVEDDAPSIDKGEGTETEKPDNATPTTENLASEATDGTIDSQANTVPEPPTDTAPSPQTADGKDVADVKEKEEGMIQRLVRHLKTNYSFRYNLLTEQTECAKLTDKYGERIDETHLVYLPADNRLLNGMALSAMDRGINCWDRDVKRFVESDLVDTYHPFRLYFDTLPEWDGKDRVGELAMRVSDEKVWVSGFRRWLLGMTAQWMGFGESSRANSVAPILVSVEQGWGKSTFCRMLMPKELRRYFTESYDLNAPGAAECKLATFGLVNLDEFDRLPARKMPLLKNLMQMESLNIRKAYKRSSEPLQRIASFIGTSNRRDLLVDRTGSRRFICVELTHQIDCNTPIEYEQLYAQLKTELMRGERYWLSKREERKIQRHNKAFYRAVPAEEIFESCFKFAEDGEEGARILTASEIFTVMKKSNPAAMRGVTCYDLSRLLPELGQRIHTKYCNGYRVKDIQKRQNDE